MTTDPMNTTTETNVCPWTIKQRWELCIHESGHAVLGLAVTEPTAEDPNAMSMVFADGSAGSYLPSIDDDDRAMAVAAGQIAVEELGAEPVPPLPPSVGAVEPTDTDKVPDPLFRMRKPAPPPDSLRGPSDEEIVAAWCVSKAPFTPDNWRKRYDYIRYVARRNVQRFKREILLFAMELFHTGVTTHSRETFFQGVCGYVERDASVDSGKVSS